MIGIKFASFNFKGAIMKKLFKTLLLLVLLFGFTVSTVPYFSYADDGTNGDDTPIPPPPPPK